MYCFFNEFRLIRRRRRRRYRNDDDDNESEQEDDNESEQEEVIFTFRKKEQVKDLKTKNILNKPYFSKEKFYI